jgi:hypothetical protein
MRDFGSDRWYLKGATNESNGVYLFQKASLTSIQPDLPTMKGFHGERAPMGHSLSCSNAIRPGCMIIGSGRPWSESPLSSKSIGSGQARLRQGREADFPKAAARERLTRVDERPLVDNDHQS